jgi:hypothetical protein
MTNKPGRTNPWWRLPKVVRWLAMVAVSFLTALLLTAWVGGSYVVGLSTVGAFTVAWSLVEQRHHAT